MSPYKVLEDKFVRCKAKGWSRRDGYVPAGMPKPAKMLLKLAAISSESLSCPTVGALLPEAPLVLGAPLVLKAPLLLEAPLFPTTPASILATEVELVLVLVDLGGAAPSF